MIIVPIGYGARELFDISRYAAVPLMAQPPSPAATARGSRARKS